LAAFASLALLLPAIGLYGLIAHAASRRTHEIGVRMALGAQPWDVVRSMLSDGARLAVAGLFVGVACAIALSRLVANLLYGVTPHTTKRAERMHVAADERLEKV
jgi:putative ABC transport system permease protein